MKPRPFDYVRPDTVDEVLALLAEYGDDARILAGGQSLLPMLNLRLIDPAVLIDVSRIAALESIRDLGPTIEIGATVTQIVVLISKDFMKLIGLAILIALPISWWASNEWLKNFVYKTSLSWWVFAGGGIILVAIALLVLTLRAFRSATVNPVESLRSE